MTTRATAVHRTGQADPKCAHRELQCTLREECLNERVFLSLDDAFNKVEQSRIEYNRERSHSSLGDLTPEEFAAKNQMNSAIARTAWPNIPNVGRRIAARSGLGAKLDSFSATLRSV